MNLSEGERLILLMLCDLYKSLDLKCPIDPELLRAPASGAKEVQSQANGAAPREEGVAAEVGEILDMWSAIERGYKHLTVDEKREVEAGAGPLGRGVRFSGFDSHAEDRYREAAHQLIETTERFERFQGRNLCAHMPSLDGYRRMLRLFVSMRPAMRNGRLGARQIIDLANAEKYSG
jgi:hypothetical protein